MQLHMHKHQQSRSKWRMEAYLECSSTELKFIQDNQILKQVVAQTSAIPGNGLKSLWQHASFGSDGLYNPDSKTRLVKYSLFSAVQNGLYEKIFQKASTRKIRASQLIEGFFLIGQLQVVDSAMEQLKGFVENLESHIKMEKAQKRKLR